MLRIMRNSRSSDARLPGRRLLLTVALAMAATGAFAAPLKQVKSHFPPGLARLQSLGPVDPQQRIALAIGLPLRNREALTNLLNELYQPGNTNFHRYLTPAEFTERFGPTAEDYAAVIAFANTNG